MTKVRRIRSKRGRKALGKVIVVFTALILVAAWLSPATIKLVKARRQNELLKSQLALVKQKNRELKKTIQKLNSDKYIELEARKQLGLVKKGEKAYLVIPKRVPPKKKAVPKPKSWWENAWDYLRGLFE